LTVAGTPDTVTVAAGVERAATDGAGATGGAFLAGGVATPDDCAASAELVGSIALTFMGFVLAACLRYR
jgi:hypothetical protein